MTSLFVIAFLASWAALYFTFIRPKLEAFRYTAGIYAKLNAIESGFWPKFLLSLKGAKVALIGFVTSSAPLAAAFYDNLSGVDWTAFMPSERAKFVAALLAVLGVLGPMLMVFLHQGAIADAAAVDPQK